MRVLNLREEKFFQHRRSREFRVEQDTAMAVSTSSARKQRKTHFRKYCRPALRFSRNLGRNFEMTLLGGRGGMAPAEYGKVWRSLLRRSSNSENRFRMCRDPPYRRQLFPDAARAKIPTLKVTTVMFHVTKLPLTSLPGDTADPTMT